MLMYYSKSSMKGVENLNALCCASSSIVYCDVAEKSQHSVYKYKAELSGNECGWTEAPTISSHCQSILVKKCQILKPYCVPIFILFKVGLVCVC